MQSQRLFICGYFFFFLLCKILLLKFWPRKKIQQRTQKVFNWRLYPTSLWRGSACRLSLLEKVAGGWREEGKNHLSTPALAAWLLSSPPRTAPLCRWLVRRGWAGRCPSWASRWAAVGYLTGLNSLPWLCWQHGKVNSVLLLVAPVVLVVCISNYSSVEIGATVLD